MGGMVFPPLPIPDYPVIITDRRAVTGEEIAERVPGIGEAVARKILDNLAARPMPPPQTPSEPQT